jgi:hypothetical protein
VKTVIKHIERSILKSSDRPSNAWNNKNGVCCFWQSRRARQCRHGGMHQNNNPVLVVFPYGNPLFSTPKPHFWSLNPKFVPKVYLNVYVLKKAIKIISNLELNTIPTQIINLPIFHKTFKNNSNLTTNL